MCYILFFLLHKKRSVGCGNFFLHTNWRYLGDFVYLCGCIQVPFFIYTPYLIPCSIWMRKAILSRVDTRPYWMTKGNSVNGEKRATKMKCDKMVRVLLTFSAHFYSLFHHIITISMADKNVIKFFISRQARLCARRFFSKTEVLCIWCVK